jgi:hypothetical protein
MASENLLREGAAKDLRRSFMLARIGLLIPLSVSALLADSLLLKTGRVVEGTFLGGDSRQLRMAVGDGIQTFNVTDAVTLQFGSAKAVAAPTAEPAPQAATPAAPVAPAAATGTVEISAGTPLVIRMIDSVDSERDTVGQTFRASLDEPVLVNGQIVIPRGTDAVAKLTEDQESGKLTGRTELSLCLVALTFKGKPVVIATEPVTTSSESRTGRTAKVVGGTAALGAIVGALAGGGKGAAIGGVSGAGAGTAVQALTKGQKVKIPSETLLQFTLRQPVKL